MPQWSAEDVAAMRAVEMLVLAGREWHPNRNAFVRGLLVPTTVDSLPGFFRGRELTLEEVRGLKVEELVWVFWAKDDNPEYVRFNGAYQVVELRPQDKHHELVVFGKKRTDAEAWPFDGATSRGTAYYFKAEPLASLRDAIERSVRRRR